ncbi:aminomethyl-transferring glycine dehydrogenase subunit GcvPB [Vagococcus lutrae]|uniref:aminomethyl-transferring glycine dehydrogenase subunit GcvPB n=1 Tax=Vagococcus lutrae TaxID=81947 RepID=UPI002A8389A4|nr:aminomethyl-transferring glycine dehydrogenase subunit GcvPB [Vagococcus lutrae]MDY3706154.1 aminomethyl-transferring glycine dehydrogenase subunit GcvPB [Vagococcus lutrae]
MKLIFERSFEGRFNDILPKLDVPTVTVPEAHQRAISPRLPEVSQPEISRHYTALAKETHGVNDGFYPLGSCTMKYNPKLNDEMAGLKGFTDIHPLQPLETVQGALSVFTELEKTLCEVTGMDHMTFQPAAGAHGELTALLMIKAYHVSRGDTKRTKIIIPDSAHGTNPASASMVGFETVNVPSNEKGCVDLEALKAVIGDDTAGLMLTNPNTLGIFEPNILEITSLIHKAGGLNYYDGANLNPIMGVVRPGDMGFDVVHLNIHKTFSTPHGGGGPGSGPIGCKEVLFDFLPTDYPVVADEMKVWHQSQKSIGRVKAFYGHFLVMVRALTYVKTLGSDGMKEAAMTAVLNANYLRASLKDTFEIPYDGLCMHEFVISLKDLKKETGVSALDFAKSLLDYDVHPPTMYFPMTVPEALMLEPTETETKETLDEVITLYRALHERALKEPDELLSAPHHTAIKRVDEVKAARHPILRYAFKNE